ncbi:MAG: hypothetical protein R3E95_09625 [Thiolinea sp.]
MMDTINQSRRRFMRQSTGLLVGTLVMSSGAIALLAPTKSWALELVSLETATGEALLRATRHIFPHATLEDAVYALVVKDLDQAAKDDPAIGQLLTDGVAELNKRSGGQWMAFSMEDQFPIIRRLSDTDFFQKIRSTAVVSLYNNDMAWAHFGYQGSSFDKGGYFDRGFQDLEWLPEPPAEASPPKA